MKNLTVKQTVTEELETTKAYDFKKSDVNRFTQLTKRICDDIKKAEKAYISIGCSMWEINSSEYFRIENYASIADFAADKFNYKKSSVYQYIRIIDKFGLFDSKGRPTGLAPAYQDYGVSKLIAMLPYNELQIASCSPSMTLSEIKDVGRLWLQDSQIETQDSQKETQETQEAQEAQEAQEVQDVVMNLPERVHGISVTCFDDIIKAKADLLTIYDDLLNTPEFKSKQICFNLDFVIA